MVQKTKAPNTGANGEDGTANVATALGVTAIVTGMMFAVVVAVKRYCSR